MAISDYELSKELEYLLASYLFQNKLQMQRLLSYLVQHVHSTSDTPFDQRAIGRECLGRSADFDPAENPVVRIEIGRLRKLLSRFYEEELHRPYKISIPLGGYRPALTVESVEAQPKFLPELSPSPANPERLSVLLQFTTEGEDNPELYLLRHRIRIGITVALGKQEAIRLLVGIPGKDGKVAGSIDFIMRVSLASIESKFQLSSDVYMAESEQLVFSNKKKLITDYESTDVDELLSDLVSELFDHEIGVLWREWVNERSSYKKIGALKVAALVHYQRYLFDENEENIRLAFFALKSALESNPGDKVINIALADIYYRMIIHGFEVVSDPIEKGICHIREALRFSPASENLNTLYAILTMCQQEYDFAITSFMSVEVRVGAKYFTSVFHFQVLKCLMSQWKEGFEGLETLCNRYSHYPKLFPVLAYLNFFMQADNVGILKWKKRILEQGSQTTVIQCVKLMLLPETLPVPIERDTLLSLIRKDLEE